MNDLIDRNSLLNSLEKFAPEKHDALVEMLIKKEPTVDAVPVRHGRWKKAKPHGVWVYSDAYRQCSECNDVIYLAFKMNYCPNCGTKMDGERKEE